MKSISQRRSHIKKSGFGTLSSSILTGMILVALAPLLVMSYQGYHCSREAIIELQEHQLSLILESKAVKINQWVSEITSDFGFLSAVPCARQQCGYIDSSTPIGTLNEDCNLLENLRQNHRFYTYIASYDSDWHLLAKSHEDADSIPIPEDFAKKLETNKAFTLSDAYKISEGSIIVWAGDLLKFKEMDRLGYVVSRIDVSDIIVNILESGINPGDTTVLYLRSEKGEYLYSTDMSSSQRNNNGTAHMNNEMGMQFYFNNQGRRVIGTWKKLENLNWILGVEIDEEEALNWLSILRKRAIITGLVTFVLVTVIAVRLAKHISRPLREVARVADSIAEGNHDVRLQPMGGTEATAVAKGFNKMMDEIEITHSKLTQTASLAAIGELSSSIVHEMRNPLSTIKMNLDALVEKVRGDDIYKELATIAFEQTCRVEKMLSDLLNYGKPIKPVFERLDIRPVIQRIADMVKMSHSEKNIEVFINDKRHDMMTFADTELLQRAFINILENAFEASPESGHINIVLENGYDDLEYTKISITDNGPGFPQEILARAFQPFFSFKDNGTGLGLANVKKIIDVHGGSVFIRNQKHGGACVEIRILGRESNRE
ncbi:HAMP domain-containing protein [bacterium]|nr:HAMP domain-containing protein [candidate division CSSED10-310 bacterium]